MIYEACEYSKFRKAWHEHLHSAYTRTLATVHRALIKERMSTRLHDLPDRLNMGNYCIPVDISTASHTAITPPTNTLRIIMIKHKPSQKGTTWLQALPEWKRVRNDRALFGNEQSTISWTRLSMTQTSSIMSTSEGCFMRWKMLTSTLRFPKVRVMDPFRQGELTALFHKANSSRFPQGKPKPFLQGEHKPFLQADTKPFLQTET